MNTKLICSLSAMMLFAAASTEARTVNVKPGDKSLTRAVQRWQPGDTIILAPGEYRETVNFTSTPRKPLRDLTIKAAIPGSVVFRGDIPAPKFTPAGNGIWKAQYPQMPEIVFERDTHTRYIFAATVVELESSCGRWTYDEKTKTIYIRTTDSGDPAKHFITLGVTPKHGLSIYAKSKQDGPRNILFEGFTVTGFYSRIRHPDQRIPYSQKKVPWGVVINTPQDNVIIRDITASLNGYGIGYCHNPVGGIIDNCRAWSNGNPYGYSGNGIGIFSKNSRCAVINCIGADNVGNDIFLYSGPFGADTKFDSNRAYNSIRVKGAKAKGFKVTNCITHGRISFIGYERHMKNTAVFGFAANDSRWTKSNLLMKYEKSLDPDKIFADPENFDCRPVAGVPEHVVKRAPQKPCKNLFFVSSKGNDSANGGSPATAFATLARAQKELAKSGRELYITDAVKGNITLKGLKNVIIRGRGKYAAKINGTISIENCSNVKLERLMPDSITVKNSKNITVNQSYGNFSASGVEKLRLAHNYFKSAKVANCRNGFITANVFDTFSKTKFTGWSDYNACADKVPADEKYSFKAKAIPGAKGTFKNAHLFDGRAIDTMPVGPFRRQFRNAVQKFGKFSFKSITPETAVVELEANLPFSGQLFFGETPKTGKKINFAAVSCKQSITLAGLKPGKKYYVGCRAVTVLENGFSNADLSGKRRSSVYRPRPVDFTTATEFAEAREYFVSNNGSDSAKGSAAAPWRSVAYAVNKLLPGDTLTIKGGTYSETIDVCVSGTDERPITIRGAKGEKVIFNGGFGNALADGFRIRNQSNLIFENMTAAGSYMLSDVGYTFAPFQVSNCRNITFRRMLVGGGTHKILVNKSKNLLIEDCAFAFGHEGLTLISTDAVVRNCTFATNGVCQIRFLNHGGEKVVLENSIIGDMLLMKTRNAPVMVNSADNFIERNNCFFVRLPESKRNAYGWNIANGKLAKKIVHDAYVGRFPGTYAQFNKTLKRTGTSFFTNPGIKLIKKLEVTYPDIETWKKNWKKDQKKSYKEYNNAKYADRIEFANYLPTNPEVIKRNCGPRMK